MKQILRKLLNKISIQSYYSKELNRNIVDYNTLLSSFHDIDIDLRSKVVINGQYCWQNCSNTEMCEKCNRLYNGDIDYFENYTNVYDTTSGGNIDNGSVETS